MSNGLTERCNLIWSINYPAYVQKDQKIGSTIYQQIFYIVRPQREIKGSRILDLCMDVHWGDQWEFYENFGRYKLLLSFFFCLKFNSLRQWTSHDFSIRIRSAIPMASACLELRIECHMFEIPNQFIIYSKIMVAIKVTYAYCFGV